MQRDNRVSTLRTRFRSARAGAKAEELLARDDARDADDGTPAGQREAARHMRRVARARGTIAQMEIRLRELRGQ
jgi:hypothetical protein